MAEQLAGQVAVVTGATSGIGLATVQAMLGAGMKVVASGRSAGDMELDNAELRKVAADITDPATAQRLLDTALSEFGRCDVLFNNAGMIEVGPIDDIDLDRVTGMVRLNVEAAFRAAYVFVRHFKAQNRGHLISTSSILGVKTRPTAGAYAATKYAIEALSEGLRLELADTPVKVSAVQPGLVLTHLHDHMPVHPVEGQGIPDPLSPQNIADAVMFQLSQPERVHVPRVMVLPKSSPL